MNKAQVPFSTLLIRSFSAKGGPVSYGGLELPTLHIQGPVLFPRLTGEFLRKGFAFFHAIAPQVTSVPEYGAKNWNIRKKRSPGPRSYLRLGLKLASPEKWG